MPILYNNSTCFGAGTLLVQLPQFLLDAQTTGKPQPRSAEQAPARGTRGEMAAGGQRWPAEAAETLPLRPPDGSVSTPHWDFSRARTGADDAGHCLHAGTQGRHRTGTRFTMRGLSESFEQPGEVSSYQSPM